MVQRALDRGVRYADGKITILELLKRYVKLKEDKRESTVTSYKAWLNIIQKEEFSHRRICDVRMSEAKEWYLHMRKTGKSYSTISALSKLIKPAFQMACDDDLILKNPFKFRMDSVLSNDSDPRSALNKDELLIWLEFILNDTVYSKHYDIFVILANTGMRVSELCGLILSDLDFSKKIIHIQKQLIRRKDGTKYIQKTKSKAGDRYVYMTPDTEKSLKKLVEQRKECMTDPEIDGYRGFLLLTENGNPKTASDIESMMRRAYKKYCKFHPEAPLPKITPHVFRHTFGTLMTELGTGVKELQTLMGHERASVTMNLYVHGNNARAVEQMASLYDFARTPEESRANI